MDAPAATPRADVPFRIAILGDFSGRGGRHAAGATPLASRRAYPIDRDEIDATIAAIAPEVRLIADPDAPPVVIRFAELEDFHPDRLAFRIPLIQKLLELRRDAQSSAPHSAPSTGAARAPAQAADALAGGSLLDMILDASPAAAPVSRAAPADELTDFVRHAVRPHAVSETSASQAALAEKIDAVVEATMRVVLHNPEFQALEALWRSTDMFVRRLDTSTDLQTFLIDVSQSEIADDLSSDAVGGSGLHRLLAGRASGNANDGGWSLIVANIALGPNDIDVMARLASLGRLLGAPVIAGAQSALAGTPSLAAEPDSDEWDSALPAGWEALRRSSDAPYLGLALPRLFLRLPYGRATDACTVVPLEENDTDGATATPHANYLWGNGAMVVALIAATGVAEGDAPATHGSIDRLPLHVETVDGEARSIPCAEAMLGQRAVARLLDRGLTPLESMRDGATVRAPRIQSVALPPRALAIPASGGSR